MTTLSSTTPYFELLRAKSSGRFSDVSVVTCLDRSDAPVDMLSAVANLHRAPAFYHGSDSNYFLVLLRCLVDGFFGVIYHKRELWWWSVVHHKQELWWQSNVRLVYGIGKNFEAYNNDYVSSLITVCFVFVGSTTHYLSRCKHCSYYLID